jgi:hypothetical protein
MEIADGTFASSVARMIAAASILEEDRRARKTKWKKRGVRSPSMFDQRLNGRHFGRSMLADQI